jgi:hypothetical protein
VLDWYTIIFELIDMRSFSNLWYWIALSVVWSMSSHWVVGVPFDMITKARKHGGSAQHDLEEMARITTGRLLFIVRQSGIWLIALASFTITGLLVLAVIYGVEFAQAVLCILIPMTLVSMLTLRTARLIEAGESHGNALHRRLIRHRMTVQGIGMVSIFFTALFGMYQNLHIGVLG